MFFNHTRTAPDPASTHLQGGLQIVAGQDPNVLPNSWTKFDADTSSIPW